MEKLTSKAGTWTHEIDSCCTKDTVDSVPNVKIKLTEFLLQDWITLTLLAVIFSVKIVLEMNRMVYEIGPINAKLTS